MTTSQDSKGATGPYTSTVMPSASADSSGQPRTQQLRSGQGLKKPVSSRSSQSRQDMSQMRSGSNAKGMAVQPGIQILPSRPSPVPIQSAIIPGQPKTLSTQSIPQIQHHLHSQPRPKPAGTSSSSPITPISSPASSPCPSPAPPSPLLACAIPPPLKNPLPAITGVSTPQELSDLVFPQPPPLDRSWVDYELASPNLPKKKQSTIIDKQSSYAREQREQLASMTSEGMPHFDLAAVHGVEEFLEEDEDEDEDEMDRRERGQGRGVDKNVRVRGRGWQSGDTTVRARDGFEIPIRWWERTSRDTDNGLRSGASSISGNSPSSVISSPKSFPSSPDSDLGSDGNYDAQIDGVPIDGVPITSRHTTTHQHGQYHQQDEPETIILYIHGGGLMIGESDSEELSCRRILVSSSPKALPNLRIYSVGYRLMPQHTASVCLGDTLTAFRRLRALHSGARSKFLLLGSSSGGELASFIAQIACSTPSPRSPSGLCCGSQSRGSKSSEWGYKSGGMRSQVDGVVLRCPVTSDIFSGLSYLPAYLHKYHTSASPAFITCLSGFMRRETPRDGLARMPVEALTEELERLPRHYIQVTSNDTLYGDGVCYAKALSDAGVEVKLEARMGWPHTYWLIAPEMEESLLADWECLRGLEWVADTPGGR